MTSSTLDLTALDFVADPYPFLAEERRRCRGDGVEAAWHELTGMWLTFTHAAAGAVLRNRRLGRIWTDREPADSLEPFNLLHRNQMMENEPPQHTRLRRIVSGAFNRGHVERLRPRVRELAKQLLAEVDRSEFDVVGEYAEPLPVLVIAELLGVDPSTATQLRLWSQAIVRMYEPSPSQQVVDAAVSAGREFADLVRDVARQRALEPRDDLISDLVRSSVLVSDPGDQQPLTEDEVVASAVLLLNAGHEASVNVFGNGLVGFLRAGGREASGGRAATAGSVRRDPGPVSTSSTTALVEEMLRFDSALQLFERTATEDVEVAGVQVREGQKIAALLGAANRDPEVFDEPDEFRADRDPNPHLAFGAGLHFCVGSPLARMELAESVALLLDEMPDLRLVGEPESRGTFVLHGYRSVRVAG